MSVDPIYNGPSGYVGMLNNPISTVDPDGEDPVTLTAIAIAVAVSATSYTASIALSDGGFNNWDWGQFGTSVFVGAVSGAITFGIGTEFQSAIKAAASNSSKVAILKVAKVATHATFQGGLSAGQGGDFWTSFASGAVGGAVGLGTENLTGTAGHVTSIGSAMVLGGFTADATGGEFWKGAAVAGIVAGANDVAHKLGDTWLERTKKDQGRPPCPDCEQIARGLRSFFAEYFGEPGKRSGQFINDLKSIPSSGVIIIGPGGQRYEVDFGQGSAIGNIATLDLSDPDNFFNNLSLIQSQGKAAARDALIISYYDENPIYERNENGFRRYQPSKKHPGFYYSPFKEYRNSDNSPIFYKSKTYQDKQGRTVYSISPTNLE